jgi:hypothetical protein
MQPSDLEDMGPIDYLVVEFPGSKMTGALSGSSTWCS